MLAWYCIAPSTSIVYIPYILIVNDDQRTTTNAYVTLQSSEMAVQRW